MYFLHGHVLLIQSIFVWCERFWHETPIGDLSPGPTSVLWRLSILCMHACCTLLKDIFKLMFFYANIPTTFVDANGKSVHEVTWFFTKWTESYYPLYIARKFTGFWVAELLEIMLKPLLSSYTIANITWLLSICMPYYEYRSLGCQTIFTWLRSAAFLTNFL